MKKIVILFAVLSGFYFSDAHAAKPSTIKEWDSCMSKVERSVDQQKIGISGVEAKIATICGERPSLGSIGFAGMVGIFPYDLARSKTWKKKFQGVIKTKYELFLDRLSVSNMTSQMGEWIVGSGMASRSGGRDEAAFAINTRTGEIFAVTLEDGELLTGFSSGSPWDEAPPFLQEWVDERR